MELDWPWCWCHDHFFKFWMLYCGRTYMPYRFTDAWLWWKLDCSMRQVCWWLFWPVLDQSHLLLCVNESIWYIEKTAMATNRFQNHDQRIARSALVRIFRTVTHSKTWRLCPECWHQNCTKKPPVKLAYVSLTFSLSNSVSTHVWLMESQYLALSWLKTNRALTQQWNFLDLQLELWYYPLLVIIFTKKRKRVFWSLEFFVRLYTWRH